jgi:hypothetical protein
MSNLARIVRKKLPEIFEEASALPDTRKRFVYSPKDLTMSVLLMFLLRQGSRNEADNTSKNLDFVENVEKFFGTKTSDLDTADLFLRDLSPEHLENLKHTVVQKLITNKTFYSERFQDKYYDIAVDGTGLQTFDYEPYPGCTYREYKNGKKVWTCYVLEAKLVTPSGFAISLATEWIENPTGIDFDKQDSENKAFKRLAAKLKKNYPRLPMLLLLDGLYPNKPVFDLCKANDWKFIITLKDKSLKTVQEQISDAVRFGKTDKISRTNRTKTEWIEDNFELIQNVEYQKDKLNVVRCLETVENIESKEKLTTNFVHITNIQTDIAKVPKLSDTGRLRWKIENEGFNSQKNEYDAQHKYSRTNSNAAKNYYQLLQIAHIINQLAYRQTHIRDFIRRHGYTLKALIGDVLGMLKFGTFTDTELIINLLNMKTQLRF